MAKKATKKATKTRKPKAPKAEAPVTETAEKSSLLRFRSNGL